jgi:hypothetical protein
MDFPDFATVPKKISDYWKKQWLFVSDTRIGQDFTLTAPH